MKLKSVSEHNEEILRFYQEGRNKTGIACTNCGSEMQTFERGVMLSYPPQMNIKCFQCGCIERIYTK